MNVKKKPQPAVIGPDLINEVAHGIVILFVEWLSVWVLECTLIWHAPVGINEGAIEVSDDDVWRFSEDIKQDLGYSSGDRASETIGVCFKPAIAGQSHPCAGVGDAAGLLIAAVRASEDHRQRALVMADQISLFIADSPHCFTSSCPVSIYPVLFVHASMLLRKRSFVRANARIEFIN